VQIGVVVTWWIEVDDAIHGIDVNAPGRHIGTDENLGSTGTEVLERSITLGLAPIPVNRHRVDALSSELARQTIRAMLGPTEHDRRSERTHEVGGDLGALVSSNLPKLV
jgi:hypothetical protein